MSAALIDCPRHSCGPPPDPTKRCLCCTEEGRRQAKTADGAARGAWPPVVRVGWNDYPIVSDASLSERGRWGEFSAIGNAIRYLHGDNRRQTAHTILHEILHAIRETSLPALFWEAVRKMEPNDAEEAIVSGFADGLSQVARDNPELWARIGEELRGQ